jgi:hypothetical protein
LAYKVTKDFKDVQDNNRLYKEGDEFPKGNSKPSKKRIEELSSKHPKHKVSFIKEVKEKKKSNKDKE